MQIRVTFILAVGLFLASSLLSASDKLSKEDRIKAAFIFQFSQFSRWPDESASKQRSPFAICVDGNDAIFSALKPLEQRKNQQREISVKPFSVAAAADCHILYLEKRSLSQKMEKIIGNPEPGLLTVSSERDFALNGGMIELKRKDGRIQIIINRQKADVAGISFSAKLLEVASLVDSGLQVDLP